MLKLVKFILHAIDSYNKVCRKRATHCKIRFPINLGKSAVDAHVISRANCHKYVPEISVKPRPMHRNFSLMTSTEISSNLVIISKCCCKRSISLTLFGLLSNVIASMYSLRSIFVITCIDATQFPLTTSKHVSVCPFHCTFMYEQYFLIQIFCVLLCLLMLDENLDNHIRFSRVHPTCIIIKCLITE